MGIAYSYVQKMDELCLFSRGSDTSVLDIGSSNLYSATAENIRGFLSKYAPKAEGVEEFAARLSHGSAYDPVRGG